MLSDRCPHCDHRVEMVTAAPTLVSCSQCGLALSGADPSVATIVTRRPATGAHRVETINLSDEFRSQYALDRLLGSGAMGCVYLARDLKMDRPVAIKFQLRMQQGQALRRFLREGKLLASVVHPNLVKVHSISVEGESPYIVMECVEGRTLRSLLDERRRVPVDQTLDLIVQCLDGLHACHLRGIVHRDMKPENILITRQNHVKIADFGIAKSYSNESDWSTTSIPTQVDFSTTRSTGAGTLIGTPRYMAPEQTRGQAAGVGSDLWAVGVILYELLAGMAPFVAETLSDLFERIQTTNPRPLAEVAPRCSSRLVAVVNRVLSREIGRRPASAEEFSAVIRLCIQERATLIQPPRVATKVASATSHPERQIAVRHRLESPEKSVDDGVMNPATPRPTIGSSRRDTMRDRLRRNPAHDDIAWVLALELIADGEFGEAREHLERAVHRLPRNAKLNALLGLVFEYMGALPAARNLLGRALALDADLEWVRLAFVRTLERQGHFEEAIRTLQAGAARENSSGTIRFGLIRLLVQPSVGSTKQLEQALAKDPSNGWIAYHLSRLGGVLQSDTVSLRDESKRLLDEALALESNGRLAEARAVYERVLGFDPSMAWATYEIERLHQLERPWPPGVPRPTSRDS